MNAISPRARQQVGRIIALAAAIVISLGVCLAGRASTALAAGDRSGAITGAPGLAASASPSTPADAPCDFVPDAACESTALSVNANWYNEGNTAGCTFTWRMSWGDKSRPTTVTANGQVAAGYYFLTNHVYKPVAATKSYTITYTAKSATGGCTIYGGSVTFTLLASTCTAATVPRVGDRPADIGGSPSRSRNSIPGEARPPGSARHELPDAGSGDGTASTAPTKGSIWAGYEASEPSGCTNYFTSVTGQWTIPAVTCPATDIGTQAVSFWVGLGDPSTVEQAGILAECRWSSVDRKYQLLYSAWHEMYPQEPGQVDFTNLHPRAGDTVIAKVSYDKNKPNPYRLQLIVAGKPAETEQACTDGCENMMAEWMSENPSPAGAKRGLPSFAPWTLSNGYATTTVNPVEQAIASLSPWPLAIEGSTGVLANACYLAGSGFTVQESPC
jgi:hypothetical protein